MMTSGEDSFPAIPLPTEEPDYIKYGRRYQRPYYKRSEKSPKDEYSVGLSTRTGKVL